MVMTAGFPSPPLVRGNERRVGGGSGATAGEGGRTAPRHRAAALQWAPDQVRGTRLFMGRDPSRQYRPRAPDLIRGPDSLAARPQVGVSGVPSA